MVGYQSQIKVSDGLGRREICQASQERREERKGKETLWSFFPPGRPDLGLDTEQRRFVLRAGKLVEEK